MAEPDTKSNPPPSQEREREKLEKRKKKKSRSKKNSRLKFYRQLKRIGKGSYGVVDLVRGKDNRLYVMKVVQNTQGRTSENGHLQEAKAEAEMLQTLRHPNIVEFHEAFVESRYLCLVMAYCRSGDLKGRVKRAKSRNKLFKEQTIMDWFVQMCFGLNYMHRKHIMHRDLKPQNVFLTENNKIVKLGDFGVTCELNNTQALAKTQVGTPYYMSPELARNDPYSFQSDVWALGCILSETCTLSVPFDAQNFTELVQKITNCEPRKLHRCYSQKLHKLVSSLLGKQPEDRLTIDRILRNEFVQEHIKSFSERYREHYGRVQPVTPNVDIYPVAERTNSRNAPPGSVARPSAPAQDKKFHAQQRTNDGANTKVDVPTSAAIKNADQQSASINSNNTASSTVAQLSATLAQRDVQIHSIKRKLKNYHNNNARVLDSDGESMDNEANVANEAQQNHENERRKLTGTLKKLIAAQVRDATVLSSVQDQIENKEQQEVKQLLQECDDNLRIAAERRAVAEKAERMLKGSLDNASAASSPLLRRVKKKIMALSPRKNLSPNRRPSQKAKVAAAKAAAAVAAISPAAALRQKNRVATTSIVTEAPRTLKNATEVGSSKSTAFSDGVIAASSYSTVTNKHIYTKQNELRQIPRVRKQKETSSKVPYTTMPNVRTHNSAHHPKDSSHHFDLQGKMPLARVPSSESKRHASRHKNTHLSSKHRSGHQSSRLPRAAQEAKMMHHQHQQQPHIHDSISSRYRRRETKIQKGSIGSSRDTRTNNIHNNSRPGTVDLETTRGSLAQSLSAERPNTGDSGSITKKSNFLSGVDPTLLQISEFQSKKAILTKLPSPPKTFTELGSRPTRSLLKQRRRMPQGGKLTPVAAKLRHNVKPAR